MNTIKNLLLFLVAGVALGSCSKVKYKKTKGGMPYQLIKGKDTQKIRVGDFIKLQLTQKVKDSVYFTTEGKLPQYQQISGQEMPYDISELWTSLRVGDSVVATQLIDTFMKRNPANIPPHLKKGDKIMTYLKVIAIFKTDSLTRTDYDNEVKKIQTAEASIIEKYLADKKITTQKTPSGAYVQIITPGTGNTIDSGNYVSVKYTGMHWSGQKFDSNTDSAFGHLQLLPVAVGSTGPGSVVKGLDEAIKLMKLGTKAKVYIPSSLAYGGNPQAGGPIKPFENLIFDVEIVDIKDKAPAQPKQQGMDPNAGIPQQ